MKWLGAAAICLNEENQLLMVLQGTVDEEKTWTVPSGGKEATEDFKACCKREVYEETGYTADIMKEIYYKHNEVVLSSLFSSHHNRWTNDDSRSRWINL